MSSDRTEKRVLNISFWFRGIQKSFEYPTLASSFGRWREPMCVCLLPYSFGLLCRNADSGDPCTDSSPLPPAPSCPGMGRRDLGSGDVIQLWIWIRAGDGSRVEQWLSNPLFHPHFLFAYFLFSGELWKEQNIAKGNDCIAVIYSLHEARSEMLPGLSLSFSKCHKESRLLVKDCFPIFQWTVSFNLINFCFKFIIIDCFCKRLEFETTVRILEIFLALKNAQFVRRTTHLSKTSTSFQTFRHFVRLCY